MAAEQKPSTAQINPAQGLKTRSWMAWILTLWFLTRFLPPAWALTLYQVYVISDQPNDLTTIQTQVPDALLVTSGEQVFILAGTFSSPTNAGRRAKTLQDLGFKTKVVSREDSEAPPKPLSPQSPSPSLPPQPIPSITPGISLPTPPLRPYTVLVLNPNRDPGLSQAVLRFFPRAQEVTYQQQPALQTGSFSQLTQAQNQSRWLNAQGFGSVVVESSTLNASLPAQASPDSSVSPPSPTPTSTSTRSPTSTPPPPPPKTDSQVKTTVSSKAVPVDPSVGELFWVLVADPVGDKLEPLKKLYPEAIPLTYDRLRVVKVGGYPDESSGQARISELNQQGYEAGLFPADLEATEPILGSAKPVSPPPQSSPPPDHSGRSNNSNNSNSSEDPAPAYVVIVNSGTPQELKQVQTIAEDAFIRTYQNKQVIQVGTYRSKKSAEAGLEKISKLGLSGQIIEQ
jgi:hypothetical protein